jgi:thioredoxin reductase (NADPH)
LKKKSAHCCKITERGKLMLYDVIITGAGPAGISAALYARRANLNVLVIHTGAQALEKAHKIENYYGFPQGISGPELYEAGLKQAENLGVTVLKDQVISLFQNSDKSFSVITAGEESGNAGGEKQFNSKTLIIACGNKKLRPAVKGITEYEGHGVSYCAVCDAFFYRNKDAVVIGNGKFAVSEADDLANTASSVKILTDGQDESEIKKTAGTKYEIITKKVKEIKGDDKTGRVNAVEFEDGEILKTDGVFIALGEAGAADFAKKAGIFLNGDSIKTDEKMRTNVKGIFACGNSTGGLLQVSKAVYEGAVAGLSAVNFLRETGEAE